MSGHNHRQTRSLRRTAIAVGIGLLFGLAAIVVIALLPISVRNSAPFGSVQTVDFDRSIATLGGEVRPNYPDFDRVQLDLRAYSKLVPGERYDFVLTVQATDDPTVVRRVAFSVPADDIPATKSAFSGIGTSVAFDAIPDSAGRSFYVWLERGARNADDIVTLWGIQSYSTLTARDVLEAAADDYDIGLSSGVNRLVIVLLMWLTLVAGSAAVACVAVAAWPGSSRRAVSPLPDRHA